MRFSTHPSSFRRVALHPNLHPQAPLKPPPTHHKQSRPSPTRVASRPGCVHTLARSQPTAAPSRESGIPFAPDTHEDSIVLSIRDGFIGAQQEGEVIDQHSTIILRRSSIWKYAFRGWGCGWGVCTSTSRCGRRKEKARPGIEPRVSLIPEGRANRCTTGPFVGEGSPTPTVEGEGDGSALGCVVPSTR